MAGRGALLHVCLLKEEGEGQRQIGKGGTKNKTSVQETGPEKTRPELWGDRARPERKS